MLCISFKLFIEILIKQPRGGLSYPPYGCV